MTTGTARSAAEWSDIVAKLQNIDQLRERGATQGEAEAAAAAFTRLLTKYNLSESEYRSRAGGFDPDGYVRETITLGYEPWARTLLHVIAKYNGCKAVGIQGSLSVVLVGLPATLELVKQMYEAYREIALACCKTAMVESPDVVKLTGTAHYRRSYMAGFAQGLADAMRAARDQAVSETENGAELVVVQENALATAVERLFGATETAPASPLNASAYERGALDGANAFGAPKALKG